MDRNADNTPTLSITTFLRKLCLSVLAAFWLTGAQAEPVEWFFHDLTFADGATGSGSLFFDADLPFGHSAAISNVNLTVGGGTTFSDMTFNSVHTTSSGNAEILRFVVDSNVDQGAISFFGALSERMTAAGGSVPFITNGNPALASQYQCGNVGCSPGGTPQNAITGGRVSTARTWYLEGVTLTSNGTAVGSYNYDAINNVFTGYNLTVSSDVAVTDYGIAQPYSSGGSTFLAAVRENSTTDLTGERVFYAVLNDEMTHSGGTINILPESVSGFSFEGKCLDSTCGGVGGPMVDVLSGRVTTERIAPQITTGANQNVFEQQIVSINIGATDNLDSEGNGLTYSLTGGSDQNLFSIEANTGTITSTITPEFADPADADMNNIYEVQITVTDLGGLTGVLDMFITVIGAPDVNVSPTLAFGSIPTFYE